MRKTDYILENETYKILWYFELQTNPPIPARRSDLVLTRKANFKIPTDNRRKIKESKKL